MYQAIRRRAQKTVVLSILAAGALLIGFGSTAAAQQAGAGSGLRISPVRTELSIKPGESKSVTVNVQNVTSASTEFQAIINDFVAGDNEYGQPALILDADKYAPSHSLKKYIAEIPNVTIAAGQNKDVKVTINVPRGAAAGGYYGAVRFAPAGTKNNNNITLSASVGSLILVKVPGDISENMVISSFDVRKGEKGINGNAFFTSNKDLYATVRFKNQGNVHEQPFGKVTLKKGNKILQTTEINNTDPKGNVLPDSTRRFVVKLDKVGSWGKYTVEGNFGYGDNGQLLSANSSFWVVPIALIVIALILLAALLFLLFGLPRAIRRYNANVVRKASRR
jgi:hypothetical protein